MNISIKDIIGLLEKRDKKITELEKKLSEMNENIPFNVEEKLKEYQKILS